MSYSQKAQWKWSVVCFGIIHDFLTGARWILADARGGLGFGSLLKHYRSLKASVRLDDEDRNILELGYLDAILRKCSEIVNHYSDLFRRLSRKGTSRCHGSPANFKPQNNGEP